MRFRVTGIGLSWCRETGVPKIPNLRLGRGSNLFVGSPKGKSAFFSLWMSLNTDPLEFFEKLRWGIEPRWRPLRTGRKTRFHLFNEMKQGRMIDVSPFQS